ncbi:MAG: glycosyltransferase family 87 protein [Rhodomicrobium sp.]
MAIGTVGLKLRMLGVLRDASWLNRSRVRFYAIILCLLMGESMASVVYVSNGMVGPAGIPLGSDFTSFRAAAGLAADGRPEAAYDRATLHTSERELFGGRDVRYFYFFYPPPFMLLCLPLALLPYGAALACWLVATGIAFWSALWGFMPRRDEILPILAFPIFFINAAFGQNGFLSGALMGFGALFLSKRPLAAGICWGALIYKPHLGLLIPFVLVAAGAWRTLTAAALTALSVSAASYAAFGTETWRGFFASSHVARMVLEQNLIGNYKMQSVFAAAGLWGLGVMPAYALQAAAALSAVTVLIWLTRKQPLGPVHGVTLAACTLLASPFLLTYDLTLLNLPLVWLASEGLRTGFRPWEKLTLLLAYALPLLAEVTTMARLAIPWTPVIVALLVLALLRRATKGCHQLPHGDQPAAVPVIMR